MMDFHDMGCSCAVKGLEHFTSIPTPSPSIITNKIRDPIILGEDGDFVIDLVKHCLMCCKTALLEQTIV